ncbi:MAG: AAA family ATPase [Methylobacter sp.]|nr:AAA family ATPase [Methylobacter sp.]
MSTFFNSVHITNFKSLKDVTLSDCKRINLLIGKPNVGKSNILEAIGLFSLPYIKYNKSKKITQFVRLENVAELFFDGDVEKEIVIKTDNSSCVVRYLQNEREIQFEIELKQFDVAMPKTGIHELDELKEVFEGKESYLIATDSRFNCLLKNKTNRHHQSKVKLYKFLQSSVAYKANYSGVFCLPLTPPNGANLFDVIQHYKLEKNLSALFSEYGLKLLFDKTNNTLRIMKSLKGDNTMVSFPYSSIADTLQRIIFFKTAIASNKDSILLFEEPEAHCFPPYIAHFTQEVINSTSNQFFIATHSPYVLNDFLEYKRDDVAIFIADFKEGQTVINRLSDDEVNEVYEYGIDVFFNYERFTTHG